MKKILITGCSDSSFWYADMVGRYVAYEGDYEDGYFSREPGGYLNIVLYKDGEVIDVPLPCSAHGVNPEM